MDRKAIGFLAENIAARYLESQGYRIINRNFRRPWGEIDVIATKDQTVYFVEVKANQEEAVISDFAPESRADPVKMAKVLKTASLYMGQAAADPEQDWQIDVISVTFDRVNQKAKIKHFKNVTEDFS